jgi:hypothetical protein
MANATARPETRLGLLALEHPRRGFVDGLLECACSLFRALKLVGELIPGERRCCNRLMEAMSLLFKGKSET